MFLRTNNKMLAALAIPVAVFVSAAFSVSPAEGADKAPPVMSIKSQVISTLNVTRAAADLFDIEVKRWSTVAERTDLIKALAQGGNTGLAAALAEQEEAGWARFDPRGGGGPGRDPRKSFIKYAFEFVRGDSKELVMLTDQFIGYGSNPMAAAGSRLTEFPISIILLKLKKDEDGNWSGGGRLVVGAKIRFDSVENRFEISGFGSDPHHIKNAKVK